MRDLNIRKFLETLLEIRRVKTVIDGFDESSRNGTVPSEVIALAQQNFAELAAATTFVGAEVAAMAAERMETKLATDGTRVLLTEIRSAIEDVENRLLDECQLISFLVLSRHQKTLFQPSRMLVNWDIDSVFPDAARELEEAAKCLALQRSTACAFHAMRMLEHGLKRLGELLEIDDPVKTADRNWIFMLRKIKCRIDEMYPPPKRMSGTEGAILEEMYAHLDAVRNPWRNETMHVDRVYTDSEAQHILNCVLFFLQALASRFSSGVPAPSPPASSSAQPLQTD